MLLVLAAFLAASVNIQGAAAPAAGEWIERERAIVAAAAAGDRGRLEALVAEDFRLRGAVQMDRAAWIRERLADCPGTRVEIGALRANQFENLAIVQFEARRDRDPSTCAPAMLQRAVVDVWIRVDGQWRVLVREAGVLQPTPPAARKPGAAWQLSSEVSLVATGGNSSTRTLGLGGDVERRAGIATTRAHAAFLTSEAEGTTNARALRLSARQGFRRRDRAELFGQAAYERDRFAGIGHRVAIDLGAAYAPRMPPRQALRLEAGLGVTREDRLDETDLRFATARGALGYAWTSDGGTELKQDLEFVADLTAARNWRGTSNTTLSVALTRLLSVKASHAVEYRHAPVEGFGRTDMRTAAALVLSFKRDPASR